MDLFQHELESAVVKLQADYTALAARVTALESAGTDDPEAETESSYSTTVLNQEVTS